MEWRTRRDSQTRPGFEPLEGRLLLDAGAAPSAEVAEIRAAAARNVSLKAKQIQYDLPGGAHVTVTLSGPGNLKGSSVGPDGALNIVFAKTGQTSGLVGRVKGGSGRAPLGSIRPSGVPLFSQTGTNGAGIAFINLHRFDLVDNGTINLLGGIGAMYLGSTGANTQVFLKQGPTSPIINPLTRTNTSSGGVITTTTTSTGTVTNTSPSGSVIVAPTTTGATLSSGTTLTGELLIPATPSTVPTQAVGIDFKIDNVRGTTGVVPRLQDPQVYATDFDGTQNRLLRIQVDPIKLTSTILQVTPLGNLGTPNAEVGLSYYQGRQVVLVGAGTTVRAYNAFDPTQLVGQFSTANLFGGAALQGIGATSTQTVLSFSTPLDPVALTLGSAQTINLTSSLNTGQAVAVGPAYIPQRGFQLVGGATGEAGSDAIIFFGSAHFDTFQPGLYQAGFLGVRTSSSGRLTEGGRAQITSPTTPLQTLPDPDGGVQTLTGVSPDPLNFNQFTAVGSIEQSVAVVTGYNAAAATNTVSLYDFRAGSFVNTLTINNPYEIRGLSQSFHPELEGASIFDVQGSLRTFRATKTVTGMVLNVNGVLDTVKIDTAIDSTIIGRPLSHVQILHRQNVGLISTSRVVAQRGDVLTYPSTKLRPLGPLATPTRVAR